jgi:hypothetical protein
MSAATMVASLSYQFLTGLDDKKLEQVVKGFDLTGRGKRVDGLMRTRGRISSLCSAKRLLPRIHPVFDPKWRGCRSVGTLRGKIDGLLSGLRWANLDKAFIQFTKARGFGASGSYKVLYDVRRLRSLMEKYVTNALDTVLSISEYRPAYYRAAGVALYEIGVNLAFAFIFTALFFKHPGYSAEGEYRYIVMTMPNSRAPGLKA